MALLLLNAGSSTLKFSVIDSADSNDRRILSEGIREWSGGDGVRQIVADVIGRSRSEKTALDAVAHRIVHGGARFTKPVRVTSDVRAALGALTELAPLHIPPSLEVLDVALETLPDTPQIAVFDTAFHATLPSHASTYPLPFEWSERWSLKRFGFHGLSHEYCAGRAAEMAERSPEGLNTVIAHLGNGASVTAVSNGRSVDTSMGFTPLEGLMMGTRSGSIDPGLLLYLQRLHSVSAEALERVLNHESGLLGVSGVSSDFQKVVRASKEGNRRASLALQIFAHRARQAIGAMAVTLGRVDVLVFTGGIGEHSAEMRAEISKGLASVGLELDHDHNAGARPDAIVSSTTSRGLILVIATREDLMMARAAVSCLADA